MIELLLQKLSLRNLREVVERFADATHGVYNDAPGVAGNDPAVGASDLDRVQTRLRPFGYDAWLAEPD